MAALCGKAGKSEPQAKEEKVVEINMLEKIDYTGNGFQPVYTREWQLAYLNYDESLEPQYVNKIERHKLTDEAFILLEGKGYLVMAQKDGGKATFSVHDLEIGVIYNVPKGAWHFYSTGKDSKLLIVENTNTHLKDVEYYELNQEELKELQGIFREMGI